MLIAQRETEKEAPPLELTELQCTPAAEPPLNFFVTGRKAQGNARERLFSRQLRNEKQGRRRRMSYFEEPIEF